MKPVRKVFHHFLDRARDSNQLRLSIVGMPFCGGQPRQGVDIGPQALRDAGLVDSLNKLGWDVRDCGDVDTSDYKRDSSHDDLGAMHTSNLDSHDVTIKVKNPTAVGKLSQRLANCVDSEIRADGGRFALVLGGDHSLAVGSIVGAARTYKDLGVVWVDAHADINSPMSSDSGNMHGMPVNFLLGLCDYRNIRGFEWLSEENSGQPVLNRDSIVYIGLRDLDPVEKLYLSQMKITYFDMTDIDKFGIHAVMDMANKTLGDVPLHCSFDIDSLDPTEAPATGTPVRGGLTFREGNYIAEYLHSTRRLVSMDLVEVNPTLGENEEDVRRTVDAGVSVITSSLGSIVV